MTYAHRILNCRGFSLIELLVVSSIIGAVVAMLLPAIQMAREAGRRATCQNNIKQVGLALSNYVDTFQTLPIGARSHKGLGVSWWVPVLPFLGEMAIFDEFDTEGADSGFALIHARNGRRVNGLSIGSMLCPSSPLAHLLSVGSFEIMMPSYVGIAGAANQGDFPERRVNKCCAPRSDGEISAGGLLIPNAAIKLRNIPDGISKTLMVGESSDYVFTNSGSPIRIDGGHRLGWIAGTAVTGTPPDYSAQNAAWNLTTIQHPLNARRYDLSGVHIDHGPNNPLVSAHFQSVNVLFADCSVTSLSNDIDVRTLKMLATRDDGEAQP